MPLQIHLQTWLLANFFSVLYFIIFIIVLYPLAKKQLKVLISKLNYFFFKPLLANLQNTINTFKNNAQRIIIILGTDSNDATSFFLCSNLTITLGYLGCVSNFEIGSSLFTFAFCWAKIFSKTTAFFFKLGLSGLLLINKWFTSFHPGVNKPLSPHVDALLTEFWSDDYSKLKQTMENTKIAPHGTDLVYAGLDLNKEDPFVFLSWYDGCSFALANTIVFIFFLFFVIIFVAIVHISPKYIELNWGLILSFAIISSCPCLKTFAFLYFGGKTILDLALFSLVFQPFLFVVLVWAFLFQNGT